MAAVGADASIDPLHMTFAFLISQVFKNKRQSFYALPLVLCHYKNLLGILGGNFVGLAFAVQGFLQGVPGQHRAFYAGRHVGDAPAGAATSSRSSSSSA